MVQAKIDQYHPDLVILDYHGLFDDASGAKTETEKAKNLSKAFKRMAVKNNVPIIDVAAVTMADGHSERPPELEEVAWSKQLAYDADLVLAIHREPSSDVFQVVSRKVRRAHHFGFYLRWNLETGKWAEEWDI
jgi:replicative DNA helicase